MAKIIVEVPEELKQDFRVECAKKDTYQREVIIHLIEKWLKRKK